MRTYIIVRLQYEAVHRWYGCELEPVSFLRVPHRHIFHIIAKKAVFHDDRDVEFILMKRAMEKYLEGKFGRPGDLDGMSCEQLAGILLVEFELQSCEVSEDGENGAVVEV